MSLDLVDQRYKATPETDAVLEALHRATGKDKSEITRDVMHEFAIKKLMEASLMTQQMKAKGLSGKDGE